MTPYAHLLGPRLAALPPACRALHGGFGRSVGQITVTGARSRALRALARAFGFPKPVDAAPLTFDTKPVDGGAQWTRRIGGHVMTSTLRAMPDGTLAETIGRVTLAARLVPEPDGLRLETAWVRVAGIPVPRLLWPRVAAREWGKATQYHFQVDIALPLGGPRLVSYRGTLHTDR